MPEQLGRNLSLLFPRLPNANELVWQLPNDFSLLSQLTQEYSDLLEITRKRIALMDVVINEEQLNLNAGMGLVAAAMDYDTGKEGLSFGHMAEHAMRSWVLIAALQPERDLKSELAVKIERWKNGLPD